MIVAMRPRASRSKRNSRDGIKVLEAIDVWSFDDDGRISTMNAYFGPTNLRDA